MNKKKRLNILSLLLVMAFSMLGLLASAVLILNSVKTPITVITGSASGIYSSESLSCDEYKIRGLDEEYSAKVTVYGSRRDVGTSQNLADVRIYDSLGIDVTFLFEIEFEYGELTVNPAKLVIRSDSAERKYNGDGLEKKTYSIVEGEICDDETISAVFSGSQTRIGRSDNVFHAEIYRIGSDGSRSLINENYILEYQYCYLKVTP